MEFLNNPATVGLIIAIPSFLLGYLAYRRSIKVDKIAEQSGIATNQLGAITQVIDGLNKLADNLKEDNASLRQNVIELSVKLKEVTEERDILKEKINHLNKKYPKRKSKSKRN